MFVPAPLLSVPNNAHAIASLRVNGGKRCCPGRLRNPSLALGWRHFPCSICCCAWRRTPPQRRRRDARRQRKRRGSFSRRTPGQRNRGAANSRPMSTDFLSTRIWLGNWGRRNCSWSRESLELRVQSLQRDAGVGGCELPVAFGVVLVAVVLPYGNFV